MIVGITGHQKLENSENWDWVEMEIHNILIQIPKPFVGVTSLAIGADQLFAKTVLQHNGRLATIIPFEGYELTFSEGNDRQNYQCLLFQSASVDVLPEMTSDEESYLEAGKRVVEMVDLLIAVWDSKPAKGLGGTADIVKYAVQSGKKIVHLDPYLHKVLDIER